MIIKKVRGKNFLSIGNAFLEVDLLKYQRTVIQGFNGSAKCLKSDTEIDIQIDDPEILKLFLEWQNSQNHK
jgi:hypothetical protein